MIEIMKFFLNINFFLCVFCISQCLGIVHYENIYWNVNVDVKRSIYTKFTYNLEDLQRLKKIKFLF